MQVWNVLHVACWKYRTQKIAKNSPPAHHRTTLWGSVFATKALIDNQKKLVRQQCVSHMFSQYGELRPTSDWDRLASLGHPSKFQWVSHLGSITVWHSSSGRQPNFAALNKGCHPCSAGRPSRWSLAGLDYILVVSRFDIEKFEWPWTDVQCCRDYMDLE